MRADEGGRGRMTPLRILSVQPVAERGGSDRALLRMIEHSTPDGLEWHVAVPEPHPLAAEFESAGATLHVVPMRRLTTRGSWPGLVAYALRWPWTVLSLRRLARRVSADVVHSNSLHSLYGWAVAVLARRPHVWHVREVVTESRAALGVERVLARRFAARVVCMSQAAADQLPGAPTVVRRELSAPGFAPQHAGRFRSTAGVPDDVPLVGVVARLWPGKGVHRALEAFTTVVDQVPATHLVVAGGRVEGNEAYGDEVVARCADLPGVTYVGDIDDVPGFMADLDLLVVPSMVPEGLGLVTVEALSSGVPVVVTDAGGAPEVVEHAADGAGSVVPMHDVGALAGAIVARLEGVETSTEIRRSRRPLMEPSWPDYPAIFREVASRSGS